MASVFVSYSHLDTLAVRRLVGELHRRAINVVIDYRDFEPGSELTHAIKQSITEANFVIVVVTTNSLASCWVAREIAFALNDAESLGRSTKVIPVRLEDCDMPKPLTERLGIDLREPDWSDGLRSLENALHKDPVLGGSGRVLIVDQRGLSSYQTISEALKAAEAGDRVVIREGVYNEPVFLAKSVEIIGHPLEPGERVEITWHESNFVQMRACHAALRNLVIRHAAPPPATPAPAHDERQPGWINVNDLIEAAHKTACFDEDMPPATGPLRIPVLESLREHVRAPRGPILFGSFSIAEDGTPISIMGKNTRPTKDDIGYSDSKVLIHQEAAILFAVDYDLQQYNAAGELLVEDCVIECGGHCNGIGTTGNVVFRRSIVTGARHKDIVQMGGGSLLIEDCRFDNGKGVETSGIGRTLINNCRFFNTGLHVKTLSRCRLLDCVFEEGPILATLSSRLEMKRCRLRKRGVALSQNAWLTMDDCSVSDCRSGGSDPGRGVYVSTGSMAWLRNCEVSSNRYGVYVSENCQGCVLDQCVITGNDSHGVFLRKEAQAKAKDSQVCSNGGHGVRCELGASVELDHCSICDNRESGVCAQEGGHASVHRCEINRNEKHGVAALDDESRVLLVGCTILQNGDGPCQGGGRISVQ